MFFFRFIVILEKLEDLDLFDFIKGHRRKMLWRKKKTSRQLWMGMSFGLNLLDNVRNLINILRVEIETVILTDEVEEDLEVFVVVGHVEAGEVVDKGVDHREIGEKGHLLGEEVDREIEGGHQRHEDRQIEEIVADRDHHREEEVVAQDVVRLLTMFENKKIFTDFLFP